MRKAIYAKSALDRIAETGKAEISKMVYWVRVRNGNQSKISLHKQSMVNGVFATKFRDPCNVTVIGSSKLES